MNPFSVLLDAPDEAGSTIQIAALGSYKDSRYGDFEITAQDVEAWKQNLDLLPGKQALIDFDHQSDKPSPHRRTEAAGWITDVFLDDGIPKAKVDWTPAGKSAIEDGRYRFFSPSYGDLRDESGTVHENVLTGGACTNKPFLSAMPQITLASAENIRQALHDEPVDVKSLLGFDKSKGLDSRPPMPLTPDILTAFGIEEEKQKTILDLDSAEERDEAKVLEAIEAAKPEPTKVDEPKSLEQADAKKMLEQEGFTVLEQPEVAKLKSDASQGAQAKKELDTQTFTHAFDAAGRKGKAVEADREFYESLPLATAVKRLEDAPQIVNIKPIGRNVNTDDLEISPAQKLDQEAKKLMLENKDMGYIEALNRAEDTLNVQLDTLGADETGSGKVKVR